MIGICKDCEFWVLVDDPNEALNECRRYPPSMGKLITKANYGCGEYRGRLMPAAKELPEKRKKK